MFSYRLSPRYTRIPDDFHKMWNFSIVATYANLQSHTENFRSIIEDRSFLLTCTHRSLVNIILADVQPKILIYERDHDNGDYSPIWRPDNPPCTQAYLLLMATDLRIRYFVELLSHKCSRMMSRYRLCWQFVWITCVIRRDYLFSKIECHVDK